jgi:hypothetical protein
LSKNIVIAFIILFSNFIECQSLTGTTGLVTIPSAEVMRDGEFSIGLNYSPREVLREYSYDHNSLLIIAMGSYLPFLEIGLRSTYPFQFKEHAIGDRMPIVRIKLFSEKDLLPSVLIGYHDFLSVYGGENAVHFNALYLVMTKNIFNGKLAATIGYGTDLLKAADHQFVGLFGGISIKLFYTLELMTEYDGKHPNGGIRIKFFDHISLIGGYINYKYFSGGGAISFQL